MPLPVCLVVASRANLDKVRAFLIEQEVSSTIDIKYADDEEGVRGALDGSSIEIAYTLKDRILPPHLHRTVIQHPRVRWFQVGGSGFDHITGILPRPALVVTNAAGVQAAHIAESVFAFLLCINRGVELARQRQRSSTWQHTPWRSISRQRLLVVGLGAIGTKVAVAARAFGMHVTAARRGGAAAGVDANGVSIVDAVVDVEDLDDALRVCDVVSFHVPLTASTEGLLSRRRIGLLKPSAVVVNTSRGAVVDEDALTEALQAERLRGAYLDVFRSEPLPEGSPLWSCERAFLTPHSADVTDDYVEKFTEFFVANLREYLAVRAQANGEIDPEVLRKRLQNVVERDAYEVRDVE